WNQAEAMRTAIDGSKALVRVQLDKVSKWEAAARTAKLRYQQAVKQAGALVEQTAAAKADLAAAEASLVEAQAILNRLQAELPKLQSQIPSYGELEIARRAAWEAIWRDLRSKIPQETQLIVACAYAALIAYK